MLGVGIFEILVVLVVALIFLGPDQLPKVARQIARFIHDFRKAGEDLKLTVMGAGDLLKDKNGPS